MNITYINKKTPKISIVIPCYNQSHYLMDAVESILCQTFKDFEVIIVNDGSTDSTQDLAQTILQDNPNFQIQLISQENSGLSATRNTGISVARGKYILPLDADDAIAPTMLEECCEILDKHPSISIVYTARKDFGEVEQIVCAGKFELEYIKYFNQISYCSMYRKQVWMDVAGYRINMKVSEDWDFWVAAASRGYMGHYIQKPLFYYRRRSNGLFQEVIKNYEKIFAQIIINNQEVYKQEEINDAKEVLLNQNHVLYLNLVARLICQIKEMEESKFWKIREVWHKLTKLL
jgi:glycosyltransferase involved in cell wall biosynthesis